MGLGQPWRPTDDVVERIYDDIARVKAGIGSVIVGQEHVVDQVLIALACGGHVLLEGVPGLGKTLLVRTLGHVLDLSFSRIQFTPDLMPADILGANILYRDELGNPTFRFQRGPIFAQLVLADEVNRTTPKTQAALLEAMQERRVTLAGVQHQLPEPFFVLATQNPLEMEGTYPLPEAQIDRFFFKLTVSPPDQEELRQILERTTGTTVSPPAAVVDGRRLLTLQAVVREVPVPSIVLDYVLRLVMATHPEHPTAPRLVREYVRYGSSPRGAQALILAAKARALFSGRFNASMDDVAASLPAAMRHRILLSFAAEADGVTADSILESVRESVEQQA